VKGGVGLGLLKYTHARAGVDLEAGNIPALVKDLEGVGAERAAASLWAQSMMDSEWAYMLAMYGPAWARDQLPPFGMEETDVRRVLEGMTGASERSRTVVELGAVSPLTRMLASPEGREAELAAGTLRCLAVRAENQELIVKAGAIGPLVRLLESSRGEEAENAAGALWSLAAPEKNEQAIAEAGAIGPLVKLLSASKAAENAAGALWSLAVRAENQELIVKAGAIGPLVRLLESSRGEEAENAAGALWSLAARDRQQGLIGEAGAIPPLVAMLSSPKGREAEVAAGALRILAHREENRVSIADAGSISLFVSMLSSPKGREAEIAMGALLNLAEQDRNEDAIAAAGAVGPLVRLADSSKGLEAVNAQALLSRLAHRTDRLAHMAGAIPRLVHSVMDPLIWGSHSLLRRLQARQDLFDDAFVHTRTMVATLPALDEDSLTALSKWYPELADEIRRSESFEAWKIHVKRCDDRLLLLSWRRGVVEMGRRGDWRSSAAGSSQAVLQLSPGGAPRDEQALEVVEPEDTPRSRHCCECVWA
jgi:hypothetical protein